MADYGIKVSEDGYDAKTAADLNLLLKSSFTLLKVKQSGTVSLSGGAATITHSLGYVPQFICFGLSDEYILTNMSNLYWYPFSFFVGDWLKAYATTTTVVLEAGSAHGTSITSAYYYIFHEAM